MTNFIITIDLDWACEAAIEMTLDYFQIKKIPVTAFTTHYSPLIEANMNNIDVGLHPYFDINSSQGATIDAIVKTVMDLPHNLPAFRCHRFLRGNESHYAMAKAGMLISSNVCTDLEVVAPFKDRFGLLEVPIFFEDGGYLWGNHSLYVSKLLEKILLAPGTKVMIIHPMHFVINTPHFTYMSDIKKSLNRSDWRGLTESDLRQLCWKKRGIRDLLTDIFDLPLEFSSFRKFITPL
jgi:hypothetical protein